MASGSRWEASEIDGVFASHHSAYPGTVPQEMWDVPEHASSLNLLTALLKSFHL